jgi:hypothetical protein
MSTEIAINRPAKTLPGAAPVAMHRGRRGDRIALARLRVKRRWLFRRRHKASLAPISPPSGCEHPDDLWRDLEQALTP